MSTAKARAAKRTPADADPTTRTRARPVERELSGRDETRAAHALRLYADGKSYSSIAKELGLTNLNVAKRYLRGVGKRLRRQNEDTLEEFLAREDARDARVMARLMALIEDPRTEPADVAKLSDSYNKVREAGIRRRERVGVLPREPDAAPMNPLSPVERHGFDRVQRLALALMEMGEGGGDRLALPPAPAKAKRMRRAKVVVGG